MPNWSSNGLDGIELNQPNFTVLHANEIFIHSLILLSLKSVSHIGKDDLRYKLMQKDAFRRSQSDNKRCLDLREKLPKADQAPIRHLDSRHRDLPLHNTNILRRTPSTRSADDLPQKDSLESSYSTWTMDNLRQRSPARIVESSRCYPLQRDDEKLQRIPTNLSFESPRSVSCVAKDVHNAPGSVSIATFMTNSLLPPMSAKPVAPIVPLHPPPSGIAHKTLYPVRSIFFYSPYHLLKSLGFWLCLL